jgi:hypothetical protein
VNVTLDKLAPDRCGVAVANQILAKTSYGMTAQGAFNLFNSKEGVLAISLFFEVRPNGAYGEETGWYQAMLGVSNVYLNRYYTNWGGSAARGTEGFKQAIMDASTPIWERTSGGNYTSRNLRTKFADSVNRILHGPANDVAGDCAGLLFSFQFAEEVVEKAFGLQYQAAWGLNIYNNVGDALYFHSYDERVPQSYWGSGVNYLKTIWTPYSRGGYRPFHFFTKSGVHVNRPAGF